MTINWFWKKDLSKPDTDSKSWASFSQEDNDKIEKAFQRKQKTCSLSSHVIDFKQSIQFRKEDSNRQRPIRRIKEEEEEKATPSSSSSSSSKKRAKESEDEEEEEEPISKKQKKSKVPAKSTTKTAKSKSTSKSSAKSLKLRSGKCRIFELYDQRRVLRSFMNPDKMVASKDSGWKPKKKDWNDDDSDDDADNDEDDDCFNEDEEIPLTEALRASLPGGHAVCYGDLLNFGNYRGVGLYVVTAKPNGSLYLRKTLGEFGYVLPACMRHIPSSYYSNSDDICIGYEMLDDSEDEYAFDNSNYVQP